MTQCGQCSEEITDNQYIYQWFAEEKTYKKVHNYHLRTKRKKGPTNAKPKPTKAA